MSFNISNNNNNNSLFQSFPNLENEIFLILNQNPNFDFIKQIFKNSISNILNKINETKSQTSKNLINNCNLLVQLFETNSKKQKRIEENENEEEKKIKISNNSEFQPNNNNEMIIDLIDNNKSIKTSTKINEEEENSLLKSFDFKFLKMKMNQFSLMVIYYDNIILKNSKLGKSGYLFEAESFTSEYGEIFNETINKLINENTSIKKLKAIETDLTIYDLVNILENNNSITSLVLDINTFYSNYELN